MALQIESGEVLLPAQERTKPTRFDDLRCRPKAELCANYSCISGIGQERNFQSVKEWIPNDDVFADVFFFLDRDRSLTRHIAG